MGGLGQWFVPFKGSIMFLGIKIEAVPGMAFSEKVQKVSTMRPDDITKLVKESGFYVQCEAGDAAFMPPGFLILVLALEESAWFKWSTLSNDLHGGHPELRHDDDFVLPRPPGQLQGLGSLLGGGGAHAFQFEHHLSGLAVVSGYARVESNTCTRKCGYARLGFTCRPERGSARGGANLTSRIGKRFVPCAFPRWRRRAQWVLSLCSGRRCK